MSTPAFAIPTYAHTALPSVSSAASNATTASALSSSQLPPSSSSGALTQRQASAHAHDAHGHSHGGASEHDDHSHSHGGHTAYAHSQHASSANTAHAGHSHNTQHTRSHSSSSSSSSSAYTQNKAANNIALSGPFLLSLLSSSDSQPAALYLTLKLAYTLQTLTIGLLALSTHLTSLAFKQFFDCTAIAFSLYSLLLTRSPSVSQSAAAPTAAYSYGYGRHELVAAFTNAIFLFFVATFTAIELFHALTSGEGSEAELEGSGRWLVVLGLLLGVASAGLLLRWSSVSAARTSHDVNMHSLWLFAVNDCITHGFTLLAALLPAISPSIHPASLTCLLYLTQASSLIYLTIPLFTVSSSTLLQRTPPHLQQQLDRAMRSVSFLDGVLEVRSSHFWCVGLEGCVGSVSVRVREGVDEAGVRREVRDVLGKCVTDLTVQVEKDVQPAWMSGQME